MCNNSVVAYFKVLSHHSLGWTGDTRNSREGSAEI
jgi:hypothetical protein